MLLFMDENKLQEVRNGRDVMIKRSNWVQLISLFDTRERPTFSLITMRRDVLYMRLPFSYLNDLNTYSPFILKIWQSRSLTAETPKIIERRGRDFFIVSPWKIKIRSTKKQLNLNFWKSKVYKLITGYFSCIFKHDWEQSVKISESQCRLLRV